MTLYFRRFKIRNPFKPSHKSYLETVLAAEAAEKTRANRLAKEAEAKRRVNSISQGDRGGFWGRAIRWVHGLRSHSPLHQWEQGRGEADIKDEDGGENDQADQALVEECWDGDWTGIMEDDD